MFAWLYISRTLRTINRVDFPTVCSLVAPIQSRDKGEEEGDINGLGSHSRPTLNYRPTECRVADSLGKDNQHFSTPL